jgi:hypothetical protein
MSRRKKNTLNAQGQLDPQKAEAAIKLFPSYNLEDQSDGEPPTKDEDGGPEDILQYLIEVGSNGMFVTITYASPEIPDERFVVHTMAEAIELLKSTL